MAANNDKADKVFDVSKPGKTAEDPSTRPVIIGHKGMLKDPMVKDGDISITDEEGDSQGPTEPEDKPSGGPQKVVESKDEPTTAPTVSRLKIVPLNDKPDDKPAAKTTKAKIAVNKTENQEKQADEKPPETDESIDVKDTTSDTEEDSTSATDESPPNPEEPKPEESKSETSSDEQKNPDAAAVDAAADQAGAAKKAEKEAKEANAIQASVNKLVASKKYFVPIGEKTRRRQNRWGIVVLVLLLLVVGAYLAADAGLVDAGFELPVDVIKN